jgi:hypothetical protein
MGSVRPHEPAKWNYYPWQNKSGEIFVFNVDRNELVPQDIGVPIESYNKRKKWPAYVEDEVQREDGRLSREIMCAGVPNKLSSAQYVVNTRARLLIQDKEEMDIISANILDNASCVVGEDVAMQHADALSYKRMRNKVAVDIAKGKYYGDTVKRLLTYKTQLFLNNTKSEFFTSDSILIHTDPRNLKAYTVGFTPIIGYPRTPREAIFMVDPQVYGYVVDGTSEGLDRKTVENFNILEMHYCTSTVVFHAYDIKHAKKIERWAKKNNPRRGVL